MKLITSDKELIPNKHYWVFFENAVRKTARLSVCSRILKRKFLCVDKDFHEMDKVFDPAYATTVVGPVEVPKLEDYKKS